MNGPRAEPRLSPVLTASYLPAVPGRCSVRVRSGQGTRATVTGSVYYRCSPCLYLGVVQRQMECLAYVDVYRCGIWHMGPTDAEFGRVIGDGRHT